MDPRVILILVLLLAAPVFFTFWLKARVKLKRMAVAVANDAAQKAAELTRTQADETKAKAEATDLRNKYGAVISQEAEVARLRGEAEEIGRKIEVLRASYAQKRELLDRLEQQVAIYDERLAFAELGVYEPHFEFNDSEVYKARIIEVRERQKAMISVKQAAHCPTEWTVENSKAKGQVMINRQTRLTMRAFNNECEATIANARWNNVVAMERRILAAQASIDKENTSLRLTLSDGYVALKIEELRLTHEYRERLKVEREEHAEMARAEREEKRLLVETEVAEREEQKYQDMLTRARKQAGADGGTEAMKKRISELEASLKEAQATSERARAMAEMTRSGYVYIISNVGSFGEDVVKIGLTRRLDPDDRVRELGDASVPFSFDTHAMIYSEEALALEFALHRQFADRRINMSNNRKEFFRVQLDEVEEAVTRLAPEASFFKDREAQEWRETLARRNQTLLELLTPLGDLPASI